MEPGEAIALRIASENGEDTDLAVAGPRSASTRPTNPCSRPNMRSIIAMRRLLKPTAITPFG
ncbi:MAG: hypothetical protein U5K37_09795 [Natrialbaceae archaeon]|nr:hypothetical protein [Natrialbaceae archaeon]